MRDTEVNQSEERGVKRVRRSAAQRAEHLAGWERSGLSAARYAGQHGLRAQDLYSWRMLAKRKEGCNATSGAPGAFMAIDVGAASGMWGAGLRVVLRVRSMEVEVSGGRSVADLAALVGAISREVGRG